MEAFLDALAAYLTADPNNKGTSAIAWILGDFGMSKPTSWPFGYITPFNDKVTPLTGGPHGVDQDDYLTPLFVVDDLHRFGDPQQVAGQQYFEQPGYRQLLTYAQSVRAALRANITLGGVVATSGVAEIRYVPVAIDTKVYRACRITVTAKQRRPR